MAVVEGTLVPLYASHARLAHVEGLLVGGTEAVAKRLCVLEEEVPALCVVKVVRADGPCG